MVDPSSPLDALASVVGEVVAPHAVEVDRAGRYPREAVDALAAAGLLGMVSAPEVGGAGAGLADAAQVIEGLARHCGSTAMVTLMHYAALAVIEAQGPRDVRQAIAQGRYVATLAFSEAGSRSHFWAPGSTAVATGGSVRLDARKSWVTSAGEADGYVWSSRATSGGPAMTLWLVAADTDGLTVGPPFDGLGLRGNASSPVAADGVVVPAGAMLGADGGGLDLAMATALPWFLVLSAAFCLGTMEAVTEAATTHLTATRLEHLDQALADQPGARAGLARMRVATDTTRAVLADTLAALGGGRDDALRRVLSVKAVAAEAAVEVTDLAMTVCGGSAFRRDLGVERRFRDVRAARVMAPTTEALLDFVGRLSCGRPLLDPVPV